MSAHADSYNGYQVKVVFNNTMQGHSAQMFSDCTEGGLKHGNAGAVHEEPKSKKYA